MVQEVVVRVSIIFSAILLCAGCATSQSLPIVHGIASEIDTDDNSTQARCDVSAVVNALASEEVQDPEPEESDQQNRETPRQLFEALSGLLDAAFGNRNTTISPDAEKLELVIRGNVSTQALIKGVIEDLEKHPEAACLVGVQVIQIDSKSLGSWDVLFYPFRMLTNGGGEGLWAIVSGKDLEAWNSAATISGLSRGCIWPGVHLRRLASAKVNSCCQVSFVSHYEKGSGESLEPAGDSMAFGMSLGLRGIRIGSEKATAMQFEAIITHAPGGMKVLPLQTSRAWIHLLNVSRKSLAGTVKIPDGCYLVLLIGPFRQDCDPQWNPDWPVMILIKPSIS